ncbi:hypothetical protein AB1E18_002318 [Capra hircus]
MRVDHPEVLRRRAEGETPQRSAATRSLPHSGGAARGSCRAAGHVAGRGAAARASERKRRTRQPAKDATWTVGPAKTPAAPPRHAHARRREPRITILGFELHFGIYQHLQCHQQLEVQLDTPPQMEAGGGQW